jgi:hypothetical protein
MGMECFFQQVHTRRVGSLTPGPAVMCLYYTRVPLWYPPNTGLNLPKKKPLFSKIMTKLDEFIIAKKKLPIFLFGKVTKFVQ